MKSMFGIGGCDGAAKSTASVGLFHYDVHRQHNGAQRSDTGGARSLPVRAVERAPADRRRRRPSTTPPGQVTTQKPGTGGSRVWSPMVIQGCGR